jgi:acetyl/propionyl-CoA carboxylase alpha subunit
MRILIANRGEIARRVIRTARRLGHETVAVYGDPDRNAAHVQDADVRYRLGPAALAESYLSHERLLAAIRETGADAVHPGYGFVAENAAFARAVVEAGARWIGPHPEAVERMGSKIEARRIATDAGVPVIPGYDASQDPADLAAAAERIGFPVLVKAAAGGGGKGIRIVHSPDEFAGALAEASTEAERSFGDGAMIVERYIQRPRHVEVQVVGDRHGDVVHLGTRECSVQRRYQKVLEEAPAPNLPDATRDGLHTAAVALASAMGYDSAGTVEFIVDDTTGEFFFLEMNTRLQVEHPVTEEVTGLDIVELMIGSARDEPLPIAQDDVTFTGHAFECRINAENPAHGFSPDIGPITRLEVGFDGDRPGVHPTGRFRWDAAVREGDTVTPFYDSMIAKLIVWDTDRPAALSTLRGWLDGLWIDGVVTTGPFHRWLVEQQPVIDGRVTTRFLDETTIPADPTPAAPYAAAAWYELGQPAGGVASLFTQLGGFRLTPHRPSVPTDVRSVDGAIHEIAPADFPAGALALCRGARVHERWLTIAIDGYPHRFTVPQRSQIWAGEAVSGAAHGDAVVAPFPGAVAEVHVEPGQTVTAGETCVVIEAMKMLHTLTSPIDGTVAGVSVAVGDQVDSRQALVTFEHVEAPTVAPVETSGATSVATSGATSGDTSLATSGDTSLATSVGTSVETPEVPE